MTVTEKDAVADRLMLSRQEVRRFAIPQTGHSIDDRVVLGELRIQRWFRQRRRVDPAV